MSKMALYVLKRVLLGLLSVWLIITFTFFAMHAIPGGPFQKEKAVTEATRIALEQKYGLDKPVHEQYFNYLKGIVTEFDFGPSLTNRGRDVIDVMADGFKVSAKLGLIAAGLAIVTGLVLGSVAAIFRNKAVDRIIMIVTTAFVAMPAFIAGSLLLVFISVKMKWLPANGTTAKGLILPVITLMLYPMAYITRLTRSSLLDVLGQDYIRTARAKGVSGVKVLFKHALKNACIPVITYAGPMIAYIITGSLVVEKIFAVPGIGRTFVSSIIDRDYMMIMGTTIFLAMVIIVMNIICDLLYKVFDPRIDFDK